MSNNVKRVIGLIIGLVVGAGFGLMIGANIGGNYYQDFVFNGLRGYEAVGQIGAFAGGVLGAAIGYFLFVLKKKAN